MVVDAGDMILFIILVGGCLGDGGIIGLRLTDEQPAAVRILLHLASTGDRFSIVDTTHRFDTFHQVAIQSIRLICANNRFISLALGNGYHITIHGTSDGVLGKACLLANDRSLANSVTIRHLVFSRLVCLACSRK